MKTRRDWTLLVVAAAGGESLSPIQLQKVLFLLERESGIDLGPGYYEFRPHNFGPYDPAVTKDADVLDQRGLVSAQMPPFGSWSEYRITDAGAERARSLTEELSESDWDAIVKIVDWTRRQSFDELCQAIYAKYPDMRAKSIYKGSLGPLPVSPPDAPDASWYARRADHVRRQFRYDPSIQEVLYEVRRASERQQLEWTTFEELDQASSAEA